MRFVSTRIIGASVLLAALLAGCGGGGGGDATTTTSGTSTTGGTTTGGTTTGGTTTGGTTTGGSTFVAGADKYVGSWVTCLVVGANSEREVLTVTKVSATQVTVAFDVDVHTGNTTCTGTGVQDLTASLSGVIGATKTTTGGETAERLDMTITSCSGGSPGDCPAPGSTEKWIGTATASQLKIGFDEQPDAQGYPSVFDTTYTKL